MCEAKPIIDDFKLKKNLSLKSVNFYERDNIGLCVAGVGGFSVVSAISFLAGAGFVNKETVMVNYGVAGAKDKEVGDFFEVNKISYVGGGAYFPVKLRDFGFVEGEVVTHDNPVLDYPDKGMVDMEAYSFFKTSLKFVSMEQIWLAKVISDNQEKQIGDRSFVTQLLSSHMEKIRKIVEFYNSLSGQLKEIDAYPEEYYYFLEKINFSFSEKVILKKNIIKLLNRGVKIDVDKIEKLGNSQRILLYLETLK